MRFPERMYLPVSLVLLLQVCLGGKALLRDPPTRAALAKWPESLQGQPIPRSPQLACRGLSPQTPQTTLTAGKPLSVTWDVSQPGDGYFDISYEPFALESEQKWFRIARFSYINDARNKQPFNLPIPGWIKSCDHCVLRFEHYGLFSSGSPELFSSCIDVKIVANAQSTQQGMGKPMFTIPGHIPADNTDGKSFRPVVASAAQHFFTGPVQAGFDTETNVWTATPAPSVVASPQTPAPVVNPPVEDTPAPTEAPTQGGTTKPIKEEADQKKKKKSFSDLPTWALVLIAIGCTLGFLLLILGIVVIVRKRKAKKIYSIEMPSTSSKYGQFY